VEHLKERRWVTGGGDEITFEQIVEQVAAHSEKNGTISVGTDSFTRKGICYFATSICLCFADDQMGGRFFVSKSKIKASRFKNVIQRITVEVERSVHMGLLLLSHCPQVSIELHLDVSGAGKGTKTSRFSDSLMGYAKGSGFDCKIKPDAYAATSVANKYSK